MNASLENNSLNNDKIIINLDKDDAYRAKVAKEFRKDGIFSSVYIRANRLVNEITRTMDCYSSDSNGDGVPQSIGNNIILFTAARGQGKTSAMNSFAAFLSGRVDSNNLLGPDISCYTDNKFEVLGIIDPTMMNQNESIVRVFLSKLFIRFESFVREEEIKEKSNSESERGQKRIDLLKLFSRCYDNINFLESIDKNYMEQNDLDSLARLGSSTELRTNLKELVDKYKIYKNVKYLVLQIDDADLSAGNIFDICEQIREYLRIPGIIVLMAADFSQLRNSVYQEYIGQYETLARMQGRINVEETCYTKTWRYLEKMFPEGHRIFLPDMGSILRNNPLKVKLHYAEVEHETNIKLNESVCANIQEQLIRLIYERTGIVFINDDKKVRSIFPETLRQLTHFIMEIGEMKPVDYNRLYLNLFWTWSRDKVLNEQIIETFGTLERNLDRLYNYYFHEWIYSRVSKDVFDVWSEIDKKNGDVHEACLIVQNQLKENLRKKKKQYLEMNQAECLHILMNMCEELENGKKEYEKLYDTICIYYSIKMNRWFIDLLKGDSNSLILDFAKNPLRFTEREQIDVLTPLYYQFPLDYENIITERFQRVDWENLFLAKQNEVGEKTSESEKYADPRELFDVWNPINYLLQMIAKSIEADKVMEQILLPLEGEKFLEPTDLLFGIRLLVTNVDVKRYVLSLLMEESRKEPDGGAWKDKLKRVYSIFDEWHKTRFAYLEISDGFTGLCELSQESDSISSKVFLSNKINYKWYCVIYGNKLEKKYKVLKEYMNQMQVAISNDMHFHDDGNIFDRDFYIPLAPSGYVLSRVLKKRKEIIKLTETEEQMKYYYEILMSMIQKDEWKKEDVEKLQQEVNKGYGDLVTLLESFKS